MANIEIVITDEESAERWANRLAQEAADSELFPDEYLFEEMALVNHCKAAG